MNKFAKKLIILLLLTALILSGCIERFAKPPQMKLSTKSLLKLPYKPLYTVLDTKQLFIIGTNKITSFNKKIEPLWNKKIKNEILTAALSPEYLIITTQDKQALLIKRHNGTIRRFYLDSLVAIKPIYNNEIFYLFDYAGSITTINTLTSQKKKFLNIKERFSNQVEIFKNSLYFGTFKKHFFQASIATKKTITQKIHFKPDTITLFHQNSYIMGGKNCNLYKFNSKTNLLEQIAIGEGWIQSPQIKNDKIYYTTVLNKLIARDANNLKIIFDFESPAALTKPLIFKNSIFITDKNGAISQISKKNGLLQGKLDLNSKELSPVILFNHNIYLTRGTELLQLQSKTMITDTRDLFKR